MWCAQSLMDLAQKQVGGFAMLDGRMVVLLLSTRAGGAAAAQQPLTVQAYIVPTSKMG